MVKPPFFGRLRPSKLSGAPCAAGGAGHSVTCGGGEGAETPLGTGGDGISESPGGLTVLRMYMYIYIYIYMGKLQYNDLTVTEAWNHEFMGNHPQPDDKM